MELCIFQYDIALFRLVFFSGEHNYGHSKLPLSSTSIFFLRLFSVLRLMFPFFTVTGGFWMWGIPSSPSWSSQYNSVTDRMLWFLTLSQLWISQTCFIACWIFIMLYFSCGKRQLLSFHFKLIGINWTQHSFYRQQYFWGSFCLPSISSSVLWCCPCVGPVLVSLIITTITNDWVEFFLH